MRLLKRRQLCLAIVGANEIGPGKFVNSRGGLPISTRPQKFRTLSRAILLLILFLFIPAFFVSSGRNLSGPADNPKTPNDAAYIGTETCRKCHEKQYQKLKDTKMGMAIFFNLRQPKLYVMNQESYPLTTSGEIGGPRKFDEAARVEDTAQALLQFDPTDKLSFSAFYDTTQDKYGQTPYGLLDKDII